MISGIPRKEISIDQLENLLRAEFPKEIPTINTIYITNYLSRPYIDDSGGSESEEKDYRHDILPIFRITHICKDKVTRYDPIGFPISLGSYRMAPVNRYCLEKSGNWNVYYRPKENPVAAEMSLTRKQREEFLQILWEYFILYDDRGDEYSPYLDSVKTKLN